MTLKDVQQFVLREFGPDYTVDAKTPAMAGDLDGDGAPDLVIVAFGKDPVNGEDDFHYRTIDPYDAFYGFGDAKMTMQFSATNPDKVRFLLVVHDLKQPKAKFVIINLPFDTLSIARLKLKKKTINALHVEEQSIDSNIYWDGKKYRWQPSGFGD